jgi:ribosome-associated toxin RatA of RatAB toxin-antitoxin module
MARAYASSIVPADVETVWSAVRDFNNLPDWHPAIQASEILDGQAPDAVGCVRRLTLTDGGIVVERLLQLDDVNRSYTYNFVESAFPVRSYVSTIRFTPVTDSGQTFVEWWADFDADADVEAELVTTFGDGVFGIGLTALRERF